MKVRRATAVDIAALHRLVESAYRGDSARRGWTHEADLLDGQRTDVEALRAMLVDPAQALLVADGEGELIGCVRVDVRSGDVAELGMLAVHPMRQGEGLGARLITTAETCAADALGASRLEMSVIDGRDALIAWYRRRGYVMTGERRPFPMHDARFGLPRRPLEFVVMSKPL